MSLKVLNSRGANTLAESAVRRFTRCISIEVELERNHSAALPERRLATLPALVLCWIFHIEFRYFDNPVFRRETNFCGLDELKFHIDM